MLDEPVLEPGDEVVTQWRPGSLGGPRGLCPTCRSTCCPGSGRPVL